MTPQHAATRGRSRAPVTRLSLDLVVETALGVLDAEGLGAVTTRRVARELGTGQASLYAYVRNKDELLAKVLEKVLADIPLPTARGTWQQRLMRYGRQTRKGLLAHPGIAAVALASVPAGTAALARGEWMLGLLRSAGLPDPVVAMAVDNIGLFVIASASEEELRTQPGSDGHDRWWSRPATGTGQEPDGAFPHTVALRPLLTSGSSQERFEFGLRLMVAGLEASLPDR